MKSYHTRLDPIKEKVLRHTETFGQFQAMSKFKVPSYDCFIRWLEEVTGDKNFGIHPKISLDGHKTLGDQLVEAFLRKVADLEATVAERDQKIEHLEWLLEQGGGKEMEHALAVLEVCRF